MVRENLGLFTELEFYSEVACNSLEGPMQSISGSCCVKLDQSPHTNDPSKYEIELQHTASSSASKFVTRSSNSKNIHCFALDESGFQSHDGSGSGHGGLVSNARHRQEDHLARNVRSEVSGSEIPSTCCGKEDLGLKDSKLSNTLQGLDFCGCGGSLISLENSANFEIDRWYCKCYTDPSSGLYSPPFTRLTY